jgi:CreA protein
MKFGNLPSADPAPAAFYDVVQSRRGNLMISYSKFLGCIAATALFATSAAAEKVGDIDVDWLGNDIIVEAFADPDVSGVTCHVAYFERGVLDRLKKGNWFEDPSNSAISCQQTGTIVLGDISQSEEGESIFSERRSIIWKSLSVKRIYDVENSTLIYVAHARELQDGSAKMSISTVPLFDLEN